MRISTDELESLISAAEALQLSPLISSVRDFSLLEGVLPLLERVLPLLEGVLPLLERVLPSKVSRNGSKAQQGLEERLKRKI